MTRFLAYVVVLSIAGLPACGRMRQDTTREEVEHIFRLGERLNRKPSDNESLDQLVKYINSSNATLRTQAVSVAGNLGEEHSEDLGDAIVPLLIERLTDSDSFVRGYAVRALGHYGRKAEPAVQGLIEVLRKYKEADDGWLAAEVLGNLGTAATPAVPELISSLDYRGPSGIHEFMMAEKAAIALFKLSPLGPEHVGELLKRVSTLSGLPQCYVALSILKSEPNNVAATEALAQVITGKKLDPAAVALQEISKLPVSIFDVRTLLTALEQCSKGPNREVRELASKQLARFRR